MWCMILYDTESVMLNVLYEVDKEWYDMMSTNSDVIQN